ncbi:peptidase S45 [Shewanella sp. NFH-SH190041]|uniref:acylase n=1 Tax=Shewanella sp. NFH-SH190041 TaxID=2950245 RepID=UPI0021C2BAA1|nr:acylase [Shewanella sp. NFH-SH190041]BDM63499.1 peptidase S45 [Shewanella sp. NFH-SH190041]
MEFNKLKLAMGIAITSMLAACGSDSDSTPPTPVNQLTTFAPDGLLQADIRRTTYGVPHIKANNLESLAFGSSYAQAQDNLCILADGFVKANSQRSQYFGPHTLDFTTGLPAQADNANIISDFAYKALKIRELAEQKLPLMSENSRAMISGFVHGYNQYLADITAAKAENPDPFCAGKPWVQPITDVDYLTYVFSITVLPGAANFLDLIFFANPGDGDEYLPRPVAVVPQQADFVAQLAKSLKAGMASLTTPEPNQSELGSNGWGLGRDKTENGRGMVLGNPHFPHTGNLRFWQSHTQIPGHINMMGGSLVGMPGLVNIGFNEALAWTHTFSTAEHFVVYQLTLDSTDRMRYLVDGKAHHITKERVTVNVNMGNNTIVPFEKDIYLTNNGPMMEAPPAKAPFGWDDSHAFMVQDVNMGNMDPLDHWLAMNRATDLASFKQTFVDYDGMIFNNTMYADKAGNTFYIDDSAVPGLSDAAVVLLRTSPELKALREQAGFTILPGDTALFNFDGATPHNLVPKLERSDFVQNSNDSFWSTNLAQPLSYYSPMYGEEAGQLSLRTRLGLKMMEDAAGSDKKFNLDELSAMLTNNRVLLPELVLTDLLSQCHAQGSEPVQISDSKSIDITGACIALQQWNGAQHNHSIGGALIREFALLFDEKTMFVVPFDPANAATTPHTLNPDGSALVALARAYANLTEAGFSADAPLGDVQFVERSRPEGTASGHKLPWPGSHHEEGGFNVYATWLSGDDTLIPQHTYPSSLDVVDNKPLASGLTAEGYPIRYGSSWMFVVGFTDTGPKAEGILTYSQSTNPWRPEFTDQSEFYSEYGKLRPLLYTEDEITAGQISHMMLEKQQ